MSNGAPPSPSTHALSRNAALVVGAVLVACAFVVVPGVWTGFAAIEGFVSLPVAILVVAACAGVGLALLRALRIDVGDDAAWIAVAVGAVVVGHVQLVLAHAGVFGRASSLAVVAVGLLLLPAGARPLRDARFPFDMSTRAGALWLAACAPFLAAALLYCALPPSFYDALVYHVGLVEQLIVRAHADLGAVVTPHNMYTAMPLASELAAGTAFAIAGQGHAEAMSLVHALWFAALVLGTASVARAAFGVHCAGPAAFVVASMPLPLFLAAADKPDVLHALLALVALRAVVRGVRDVRAQAADGRIDGRLLFLALGLACATKLSALAMGLALTIAVLAVPWTRKALFATANERRDVVIGLVAGAVVAAPAYVRNAIELGNPFYPFPSSLFGAPSGGDTSSWLPHTLALLNGDAIRARALADVVPLLVKPFFGTDAFANEAVGPLGLFALLGLVLALLPATAGTRARRVALTLVALVAATLVPWLATHALPRYAPVLWLAVAVLAGFAIARLVATPVVRWIAVAVIAALTIANASWSLRANEALLRGPMRALAGAADRADFVTSVLDLAPAYRAAAAAPEMGASSPSPRRCVLLATGEPRIAYLPVSTVLSDGYTKPPIAVALDEAARHGDPARALEKIRAMGATHVLIDDRAPALYAKRGWRVDAPALAALAALLTPIWSNGSGHVLFEVPAPVWGSCVLRQ